MTNSIHIMDSLQRLARRIFGNRNDRLLRRYQTQVRAINALEPRMQELSDAALQAQTAHFKERLALKDSLDDLLPEAFATVREASRRVLKMRHFDVQLLGGIALHQGKIAEMCTGEGKTLAATLPAYLNALTGQGVHVVTVNPYLAQRDADMMGVLYTFLGLSVGVIVPEQGKEARKEAYQADITYGTNNEFGFDYLRDNMAFEVEDRVQRQLNYCLIDEVDSILIDEARTPLIISGAAEDSSALYLELNSLVEKLKQAPAVEKDPKAMAGEQPEPDGDFTVDEKDKQVHLTDAGHQQAEALLQEAGLFADGTSNLYDAQNMLLMHHLHAALRAKYLFQRNVDYIVKDGEVVIIDEHTGRAMTGRRWGDGLHQAVEAKEGVKIQSENQTLASITFQNFFRQYNKLSGMTGTADTEAPEFHQIYDLEVVVIPTHKPLIRDDQEDLIYLTQAGKFKAIVAAIQEKHAKGQPVLVGTASIEASEHLSHLLQEAEVPHEVLNAKQHEREASIIAEAGMKGAVTIATNMAGRGTDIVLGGIKTGDDDSAWAQRHDEILALGGLHVLGTERHESRRIDNQLRGRSGRQGDPGSSRFYLSLEDTLMRIFASDRVAGMMRRLGMSDDEPIGHSMVNRAIENAQRKVEGHNFDIRKQLLSYDDVANDQRKLMYQQRIELMEAQDFADLIRRMQAAVIEACVARHMPDDSMAELWTVSELEQQLQHEFQLKADVSSWLQSEPELDGAGVAERVLKQLRTDYQSKCKALGDQQPLIEKSIALQVLDSHWKEHLAAMDYLRRGIHLRGYAQKNPVHEYKREAFVLFNDMLSAIQAEIIHLLATMQFESQDAEQLEAQRRQAAMGQRVEFVHDAAEGLAGALEADEAEATPKPSQTIRYSPQISRNALCPCGSGKKYKHCHGKI